jgi:hypothetical protein
MRYKQKTLQENNLTTHLNTTIKKRKSIPQKRAICHNLTPMQALKTKTRKLTRTNNLHNPMKTTTFAWLKPPKMVGT